MLAHTTTQLLAHNTTSGAGTALLAKMFFVHPTSWTQTLSNCQTADMHAKTGALLTRALTFTVMPSAATCFQAFTVHSLHAQKK